MAGINAVMTDKNYREKKHVSPLRGNEKAATMTSSKPTSFADRWDEMVTIYSDYLIRY